MIEEGFVEDEAGLGLGPVSTSALDPKTAALLQVGACVAIGSSAVCLEWSTGRALAAGANEDEIADVLLAIAPGGRARPGRLRRARRGDRARIRHRGRAGGTRLTGRQLVTFNLRRAAAKEADMATSDPPESSWTVVLRRQPARLVEGQPEGGYTDVYEIICCDCGDDPDLDYREVSPRLQLVRGPYPIAAGVAAYEQHLKLHEQMGRATGTKAAIALLMGAYLAVSGPVRLS